MRLAVADGVNIDSLRYGTPEWESARQERQGRPAGTHIREDPAEHEEVVVSAFEGPDFEEAVRRVYGFHADREGATMPSRTRWLPADWGSSNTLTVLTMMIGFGITIFGGYSIYRDNQERQNQFNTETLGTLRSLAQAIQANDAADKENALRFAPQIEAATRLQDVTNARLENLMKSVADIREQIQDMGKTQMQDHADVQVLRSRMEERGALRGN